MSDLWLLSADSSDPLARSARELGWSVATELAPEEAVGTTRAVVAIRVCADTPAVQLRAWREAFPGALLIGPATLDVDLVLENPLADSALLRRLLMHAETHWRRHGELQELQHALESRKQQVQQLNAIGVALSSRMPLDDLLATLLREARALAQCDGASLYLVEKKKGEEHLVFKLTQNGSVEVPFVEATVPLSSESIAGYVALIGEELNLSDAYRLPDNAPYRFNRTFDEKMGYRTRSMLVLPMRDHYRRVVGVLQFINRQSPDGTITEFDDEVLHILRAIVSQAALSIQKGRLVEDINDLFESFVQASVKAIEQRDPSTSGHSARVAETTVELLRALPLSNLPRFRNLDIPENHIREVRYAALLHDFGKVGVREAILVKSHKLTAERVEVLNYRIELQKERLRRAAVEREVQMLHHGAVDFEVARARVHRDLQQQLRLLDDYFGMIVAANNPTVISDGDFAHLEQIYRTPFVESDGTQTSLISRDDLTALSVRRGSLTPAERQEIESHVRHTMDFLAVLPWPEELAQVPSIAGAHHEKLNGKGYPLGLRGEEIPLASRVMTVCDIFDALTTMDRPYKSAISEQGAFDILYQEAAEGLLDTDIVDVFVASRSQLGARRA